MSGKEYFNNIIDKMFRMPAWKIYLVIIFILGFVLRFIAARNVGVSADDMHFVTHAINFFSSGKLVTYDQSSGLWFIFTDFMYGLFGTTQIASRMAALIFGSLSIILIYFLSREFFGERASLFAAFLLAISPFNIRYTVAEMDVMAIFFVLFSTLFFVRGIKRESALLMILSGLGMGLAIYTKVYPLLFLPSFLLFFVYIQKKSRKKIFTRNNVKILLLFLIIAGFFAIPALSHNYILYNEKGFLDLQFTRTLDLGKDVSEQHYGWDHQFNAENDWKGLLLGDSPNGGGGKPLLWAAFLFLLKGDAILLILGMLGIINIILSKKEKHRECVVLYVLIVIFAFPFLASIILLSKHFLFAIVFISPLAGNFLEILVHKIRRISKKPEMIVLVVLMLSSFVYLGLSGTSSGVHFYGESYISQMMKFKESSIPKESVIIMDSRFYRGQIHWASQGRMYLEGTQFLDFMGQQENIPGNKVDIKVHYFECVSDDCGWGSIKNQPEFNASMEDLTKMFSDGGLLKETIHAPVKNKNYYPFISNKQESVRVYEANVAVKPQIINLVKEPKNWFLYNIGYPNGYEEFDQIYAINPVDSVIYRIARLMQYVSVFFLFASIVFVGYLIYKEK